MTAFAQAPALGIETFGKTLQPVAGELDRLLDNNITFGVWSGAHAALLGGHRTSQDIDALVADHELPLLPHIFPEAEIIDIHDRYMVRPRGDLMELMGRMTVHTCDGAFDLRLTPNAADRIGLQEIDGRPVPFVAPEDTILLKAMLGRGPAEGKHDLADIDAIIDSVPIERRYLFERVEETGSIYRILQVPRIMHLLFSL